MTNLMITASETIARIGELTESGLSRRQIARITGLGKSTVDDIIHGRYGLSPARATTVAGKLTQHYVQRELKQKHETGLSVRSIAAQAGISKTTAHEVITGKRAISPVMAHKALEGLSAPHGMRLLTPHGFRIVVPLRPKDWSLLGQHDRALRMYNEGDTAALRKFTGKTVRTTSGEYTLITDPAVIKRLARQGSMDVDDVVIGESPGAKRRRGN